MRAQRRFGMKGSFPKHGAKLVKINYIPTILATFLRKFCVQCPFGIFALIVFFIIKRKIPVKSFVKFNGMITI